jgi:hypothetical protein
VEMPPIQTSDSLVGLVVGLVLAATCAGALGDQESRLGTVMWRWFSWRRDPRSARVNLLLMAGFGILLAVASLVGLLF